MRVLLNEGVPRRLCRELSGHSVRTVVEMGWGGVKNGALLRLATAEFDCVLTVDRNMQFQQNTSTLPLAVVVIRASGNDFASLRPLVPSLLASLDQLQPGRMVKVGI